MINIAIDTKQLDRARKILANIPGAFRKASNRALKLSAQHLKTRLRVETGQRYYAKSGKIGASMKLSTSNGSAKIVSRGPRLPITEYHVTPKRHVKGKRDRLKGAVKKTGVKSLGKAFFAANGFPYIRTGKSRWDIRRMMSPAIPQIIGNEEVIESASQDFNEFFERQLNHEIMYQIGAFAK